MDANLLVMFEDAQLKSTVYFRIMENGFIEDLVLLL